PKLCLYPTFSAAMDVRTTQRLFYSRRIFLADVSSRILTLGLNPSYILCRWIFLTREFLRYFFPESNTQGIEHVPIVSLPSFGSFRKVAGWLGLSATSISGTAGMDLGLKPSSQPRGLDCHSLPPSWRRCFRSRWDFGCTA